MYKSSWTWQQYLDQIRVRNLDLAQLEALGEVNSLIAIDRMNEFPEETNKVVNDFLAKVMK